MLEFSNIIKAMNHNATLTNPHGCNDIIPLAADVRSLFKKPENVTQAVSLPELKLPDDIVTDVFEKISK